jgi:hypothetical protein
MMKNDTGAELLSLVDGFVARRASFDEEPNLKEIEWAALEDVLNHVYELAILSGETPEKARELSQNAFGDCEALLGARRCANCRKTDSAGLQYCDFCKT